MQDNNTQPTDQSIFGANSDVQKARSYSTKDLFHQRWPYYVFCGVLLLLIALTTGLSYGLKPREKRDYKDYQALHISERSDLLNRLAEKYYVVFYQPGCAGCEYLRTDLFNYIDNLSDKQPLVYLVDASEMFTCATCVPPDDYVGITDPEKIFINATPSMIRVENRSVSGYYLAAGDIVTELGTNSRT